MPLTEAQVLGHILRQIGEVDPETGEPLDSGDLAETALPELWLRHADKGRVPGLRALYVARDGLDIVLARLADLVDETVLDATSKESQAVVNRRAQRDRLQAMIDRAETQARAARPPAAGTLRTSAPVAPPAGHPDANDPRYSGSPYRPLSGRIR